MRCSVVFGVTLRLILVINISSFSVAINTAAYYQRCVTTSGTLAVLHRRLCWQHLACCSAQNRDFCLPHLHSTLPLGVFPSEYRHPVSYGKTRIDAATRRWKKFRRYIYSFWHDPRTWQTHRHTNRHIHTDRHRMTPGFALMVSEIYSFRAEFSEKNF